MSERTFLIQKVSNCCGAEDTGIWEELEVCPQCKEPCEFINPEEDDDEYEE